MLRCTTLAARQPAQLFLFLFLIVFPCIGPKRPRSILWSFTYTLGTTGGSYVNPQTTNVMTITEITSAISCAVSVASSLCQYDMPLLEANVLPMPDRPAQEKIPEYLGQYQVRKALVRSPLSSKEPPCFNDTSNACLLHILYSLYYGSTAEDSVDHKYSCGDVLV